MRVLAFDIGIKNLAYAVVEAEQVIAVENINLLAEEDSKAATGLCHGCVARKVKKPCRGAYRISDPSDPSDPSDQVYCQKHLPPTHRVSALWSKPMRAQKKRLQQLLAETPSLLVARPPTTIEGLVALLSTVYAIPVAPPKRTKASALSLEQLHDLLRAAVAERADLFRTCDLLLLENQPAFKNPHMKSVQVLLFAVLRELFFVQGAAAPPPIHLVHAAKKTKEQNHRIAAGDAGYADRKRTTEDRVHELVRGGSLLGGSWYNGWMTAKKRSDMADALCMCVDNLPLLL